MEVPYPANGADRFLALDDDGQWRRRWQEFPAPLDHGLAIAVGEKAEVPDLHEATGKNMEEEAPDEFHRIERHLLNLIVVLRIPPAPSSREASWEQQATRRKSAVHQGVERVRNSLFHRVKNVSFSHTPAVTPKLIGAAEATSRCSSRIYNGGW
jgi:hypothetical protein